MPEGARRLAGVAGRKWLATTQAKARLLEFLAQSGPLDEWLAAHVGPGRTA